jgi:tRNA A37 threonylcarbamoyladenosine synthetase subunit TsaC/SUA5/YrdC
LIYLAQTDTTVGFLSTSKEELARAKKRDINQPFIICVSSFRKLKKLTRVPKKDKKLVRRSKKTTFIYPNNKAIRVVKDDKHNELLKKFDYLFSTSANKHKKPFELSYALKMVDIVVKTPEGFSENTPSKMIKLTKTSQQPLRKL